MGYPAILAIAEEEQVGRLRLLERSVNRNALRRLLPCVPQKMNSVKRKDALNHPRAIRSPRRDSAPLVVSPLKQCGRGSDDGIRRRWESRSPMSEIHRPACNHMPATYDGAEGKIQHRTAGVADAAAHRDLTLDVPAPRNRTSIFARSSETLVHPSVVAVGSAHLEPPPFRPDNFRAMAV